MTGLLFGKGPVNKRMRRCIYAVLLIALTQIQTPKAELIDEFMEQANDILKNFGAQVQYAFDRKCQFLKDCSPAECTEHLCSAQKSDTYFCSEVLGNDDATCPYCPGRLVDMENTNIRTPGNTYVPETDSLEFDENLRTDICYTRDLTRSMAILWATSDSSAWFYTSSTAGMLRTYPSVLGGRESNLSSCVVDASYDPRLRPWYNNAAIGPHRLIFVLDRSTLMEETPVGSSTAFQSAKDFITSYIGTLSKTMSATIVTAEEDSEILFGYSDPPALTDVNKRRIVDGLEDLRATGRPALLPGLRKAIEVYLGDGDEIINPCFTHIIVVTQGTFTCNLDNCSDPRQPCSCTTEAVSAVEAMLADLPTNAMSLAVDFLNVGENSNTQTTRSVNCLFDNSKFSLWTNPDNIMEVFEQIASHASLSRNPEETGINEDTVTFSEIYKDALGLGFMITAAVPIFHSQAPFMQGVVGFDIIVESLIEDDPRNIDLLGELMLNVKCVDRPITDDGCRQQTIRGERSSCALKYDASTCFTDQLTYVTVSESLTFDQANEYCRSSVNPNREGRLAFPKSKSQASTLAGLADMDGSWIHARGNAQSGFMTLGPGGDEVQVTNYFFDHPSDRELGFDPNNCITHDYRGEINQWKVVPCDARRPFICQFDAAEDADADCARLTANTFHRRYENCPTAFGSCGLEVPPTDEVICDLGDLSKPNCELICCYGCSCENKLTSGDILSIAVGSVLGSLTLLVLSSALLLSLKKRKRAKLVEETE